MQMRLPTEVKLVGPNIDHRRYIGADVYSLPVVRNCFIGGLVESGYVDLSPPHKAYTLTVGNWIL